MTSHWLLLIFAVVVMQIGVNTQEFSYEGQKGPDKWHKLFEECKGKHQSPINIKNLHVRKAKLPTLIFHNFNQVPRSAKLQNNGHTAMLTIQSDRIPEISGGPLTGPYIFAQLHYHWGETDFDGSELEINGYRYPMELHVVFFKKEYKNMTNAQTKSDGLAVMSFFLEISDTPNRAYTEMTQVLENIKAFNTSASFTKPLALQSFMISNIHQYYVYNGSLTTPPCLEVVTWLDFYDPIKITREQLQPFRNLLNHEGNLIRHNFRPVQPIGNRIVWYTSNRFSEYDKDLYGNVLSPQVDFELEQLIFSRINFEEQNPDQNVFN